MPMPGWHGELARRGASDSDSDSVVRHTGSDSDSDSDSVSVVRHTGSDSDSDSDSVSGSVSVPVSA